MAKFKDPAEINQAGLQILKSIKPSLNINDQNSDFVIRQKVLSGLLSGVYGDQAKVYLDTFTSTARPEALILKGIDLGLSLQAATISSGSSAVTIAGTNGVVVAPGDLTFLYEPTNLFYTNTSGGTIANGTLVLSLQSQAVGSINNIASPDTITIVSPPTGVSDQASVTSDIAGGSDQESYDSFRARILARERNTPAGGNSADFTSWAYEADSSVRSVSITRFIKGLGTVGVAITTGVTDIDSAVTNGTAIVRVPSQAVIDRVQTYYDTHAPVTACTVVYGPTEQSFDVTVKVVPAGSLTLSSVPPSIYNPQGLTVLQLVQREVARALYKAPIGGRKRSGSTVGYVYSSDIEVNIDYWLSAELDPATGQPKGLIPILDDRQVTSIAGDDNEAPVGTNSLPIPGTVTVGAF